MQSPPVYSTCKTYERADHAQRALKKPDKPKWRVARRSREPEEGPEKWPRYATGPYVYSLYPKWHLKRASNGYRNPDRARGRGDFLVFYVTSNFSTDPNRFETKLWGMHTLELYITLTKFQLPPSRFIFSVFGPYNSGNFPGQEISVNQ